MNSKEKEDRKENPSLKPRTTARSSKFDAELSLTMAIYLGMLFLFLAVAAYVTAFTVDQPSGPEYTKAWLKAHWSQFYFVQAKHMVRPLIMESLQPAESNSGQIQAGKDTAQAAEISDAKSNDTATAPRSSWSIEKWSRQFFDPDTGCAEIGNGVWYAVGTVDARSTGGATVHLPWTIFFVAESSTPLFSKVGDKVSGDLDQVRKIAHVALSSPRSNP